MCNEYVTPLFGKVNVRMQLLTHGREAASSASARNKLQKQIDIFKKKISDISVLERIVQKNSRYGFCRQSDVAGEMLKTASAAKAEGYPEP
jgi:hypothetical protein